MKSTTHLAAGIMLAPAANVLAANLFHANYSAYACMVGFILGSKAPDWLEIRWWRNGVRYSVIPHRTLTHTWWLWVLALVFGIAYTAGTGIEPVWMGFCLAGLLHIFMDSLTPMGVPLANPFGRRSRLKLGALRYDGVFMLALVPVAAVLWRGFF